MSKQLPGDFDPDLYGAAYPDVGLSGLSAKEHYLRFGRCLGRSPSGKGTQPAVARSPVAGEGSDRSSSSPTPDLLTPGKPAREAIIERPEEFEPADVVPQPAPLNPADDGFGICSITSLSRVVLASTEHGETLCRPLAAYARLFSLEAPIAPQSDDMFLYASSFFRSGETRIENAWFAGAKILRLAIAGGADRPAMSEGWALRAYQASPANPAQLRSTGPGVRFPSRGPVFHDLELVDSLMPIILELSDREGITRETALMPFPSLLPGGLHFAELKALQIEPNPMDAFWAFSEILLRERLGGTDSPVRSVTDLAFYSESTATSDEISMPDIEPWLSAVFGLSMRSGANDRAGLRLLLPTDSVPSISALSSRRLNVRAGAQQSGPLLIVDSKSLRPRWSAALPPGTEAGCSFPALQGMSGKSRGKASSPALPVHLAIARRPADHPFELDAPSTSESESVDAVPLSVLLEASDEARTEALVHILLQVTGNSGLELFVRLPHNKTALPELFDRLRGAGGWSEVPATADLRDLAKSAGHELILTVNDRVNLGGPLTVLALTKLAQETEDAGSVGCVLLGETIIKKDVVLRPVSGGIFPAGVSFSSSPGLTFNEPEVLQALSNCTYPVVANTFMLTIWRKQALVGLPQLDFQVIATSADIRLGLDLMEAGFRNLCTSKVSAGWSGAYVRHDVIDPVGSVYVEPERWADILRRVTILRELF